LVQDQNKNNAHDVSAFQILHSRVVRLVELGGAISVS